MSVLQSKKHQVEGHLEKERPPSTRGWPSGPAIPPSLGLSSSSTSTGLYATLAVKMIKALYYKAGGDRELTIVLVHDLEGNAWTRCSTAPSLIGARGRS